MPDALRSTAAVVALSLAFGWTAPAQPVGVESVFDGKTLEGWSGDRDYWRAQDGSIIGEIGDGKTLKKNEFIYWDGGELADFELSVEYRISGLPSANSGIQIRSARLADGHAKGFQADLDDGAVWLGRVYEEAGRGLVAERGTRVSIAPDGRRWTDPLPVAVDFKAVPKRDGWNIYEISARGSHLELRVNGKLFSVLDDHQSNAAKYAGKLAFQLHSGKGPSRIEFRNIRLKHLGRTALPPAMAGNGGEPVSGADGVVSIAPLGADGKPLNLGFEMGTLQGWKAEGDAWNGQPVRGDTVAPRKPGQRSNHAGQFWIGGYEPQHHDRGTGRLVSEPFEVTHPWASFLVGGGRASETRVEVVLEPGGEVIHRAHGAEMETMARSVVDLRPWMHRRIFVRLVDESKIGWGHLNFDDFVFHEAPPTPQPVVAGTGNRLHDSPVLWHLRPNPARFAGVPVKGSGGDVVTGMMLTQGFRADLIAEEPVVRQPNAFTIDERGRLWIVEALGYPVKQPEGQGRDRILILEDTKGDGRFDKRTVFMEGLNLVSGIEVGFGGVWIGAAPQLIFIPKDADDRAGQPQVLLDGFGYQDTHETLNSFIWGPDGWLYGNQGVFNHALIGKPGAPDGERVELRSGVWRYHPVRRMFEVFAHGGSNQWGLDFNSTGDLFMTHCRSFHGGGGTSYVIRNGHYWNQANSNYAPFISSRAPAFAPDLKNFLPASARYDDGEGGAGRPGTTAIYGGHSHVGTMIYQGDNWPDIYRDHLFTHNLHGHQMNHQVNVREGSGYETLQGGYDLLYAPDPRYIPVALKCGPDGAVYIIDWCDTQHCHTPHEEKWDRSNGRVYRVSWAQTYRPVKVDLGKMSDVELAKLQTHKNDWYARTARRLLMERSAAGGVDARATEMLRTMLVDFRDDSQALRAEWSLGVIGKLNADPQLSGPALLDLAMAHPSPDVRAWAVRFSSQDGVVDPSLAQRLVAMASKDPSPVVRLALASALPLLPEEERWLTADALAMHREDAGDRFLPKMIWYGLAPLTGRDPARALALAARTPLPGLAVSIRWFLARAPGGRDQLAAMVRDAKADDALRTLRLLSFSLEQDSMVSPPKDWAQAAVRARTLPDDEARVLTEQLDAVFGDKAILAKMRETLADGKAAMPERRRAFDLLKRVGDTESVAVFASLLDNAAFRLEVIPLLSRSDDARGAEALLRRLNEFNEAERAAALNTLTSRPALALPLLRAINEGKVEKNHLTSLHIRQLRNLNHDDVSRLTEVMWGKVSESSAAFKAGIARFKKAFSEAPLWAYDGTAGKKVFERACMPCHSMNGSGGKLGPDLAGSWRNGIDYFLENIIDPNAVIGEAFQLTVVTKTDGNVVAGMFDKETDEAVLIRTITETVSVPKAAIKQRQVLPQSLMPPGLLEAMPEREAIELLKYLTTKP